MSRSNCLFWAIAMRWRRWRKGKEGSIRYRQSNFGWFPHFLYRERGRLYSYVPDDPKHRLFPPPLFKGHSKFGDLH